MEKPQIEIANPAKPLFTFSAIRHRHLKSYTYNTFVNIFSHFYQNSQGERVCGGPIGGEGGNDVRGALGGIEEVLGVEEEIEGLLGLNGGDGREERVMEELEGIIKGNGEVADGDGGDHSSMLVDGNGCDGVDNVIDRESNAETCREAKAAQDISEEKFKVVDLDMGDSVMTGVVEAGENCGGNDPDACLLEVGNSELRKTVEVDNSVCDGGALSSVDHMIEDGEIEVGELPADLINGDETANNVTLNSLVLNVKEDGIAVSDNKDIEGYSFDEQNRSDKRDSVAILLENDVVARNGRIELDKKSSEVLIHQPGSLNVDLKSQEANLKLSMFEQGRKAEKVADANGRMGDLPSRRSTLVFYGDIMENNPTNIQENISTKGQNADVSNKKKRGGLTEERKAKKKAKKRKKRAEKNRQLGVKRLKLLPVTKPKTVSYCRHYLKGRCQEGEKCKFSHDTVPLTKSTPCCYFARKLCMKGDDCPFDHQLFKYPCNNFVSKGFCIRGDECMFSHKMPLADNSAANSGIGDSELQTSSILVKSNSKQLNVSNLSSLNSKALSNSKDSYPCKMSEAKVTETLPRPFVSAIKGIGPFSVDNTPSVLSNKVEQSGSSKSKNDARIQTEIDQRTSVLTPNKMTMASRGINFLSFGKTLPDNTDNSLQKQASTSSNAYDRVGNLSSQKLLNRIEDNNERLNVFQPSAPPSGIKLLSFGKVSSDGVKSSSSSGCGAGAERPSQEPSPSSRPSEFSLFPWKLSGSRFLSGLPSDCNTGHTNMPNSAQKALFSTLAFAAKFESQLKMKSTDDALVGESSKPHDHQVPQNDST